jgi:hypothetical protein
MNLDPQTIQAILSANQNDPRLQVLTRQQALASQMRNRGMSPTDPIQAGRRVLPNYGGIASGLMQGLAASKMQPGIDAGMKQVNVDHTNARKQYLEALMNSMRRQAPPSMSPPQQPMQQTGGYPPMQPSEA